MSKVKADLATIRSNGWTVLLRFAYTEDYDHVSNINHFYSSITQIFLLKYFTQSQKIGLSRTVKKIY